MKKRILGIIPARSGSKGIKNKNIININGFPLIYYTIYSAIKSKLITDLIVSTDSKKIKKIAEFYGAKVPFLRPKQLSTDNSNIIDTIIFTLKKLEKNFKFDLVVLLQPTSPFRKPKEIDQAINKVIKNKFDSLMALTILNEPHPMKLKEINNNLVKSYIVNTKLKDNPPRQSLKRLYKPSGNIYISDRNLIMKKRKIQGNRGTFIIIKENDFLNIDSNEDLYRARRLLKKFK